MHEKSKRGGRTRVFLCRPTTPNRENQGNFPVETPEGTNNLELRQKTFAEVIKLNKLIFGSVFSVHCLAFSLCMSFFQCGFNRNTDE